MCYRLWCKKRSKRGQNCLPLACRLEKPFIFMKLQDLAACKNVVQVADEVGFEPTVGFPPRRFSRPVR